MNDVRLENIKEALINKINERLDCTEDMVEQFHLDVHELVNDAVQIKLQEMTIVQLMELL